MSSQEPDMARATHFDKEFWFIAFDERKRKRNIYSISINAIRMERSTREKF